MNRRWLRDVDAGQRQSFMVTKMGDLTSNFSRREFACKCGCGADKVDLLLVVKLQTARNLCHRPMKINSGVRCREYNASLSGSNPNSAHLYGLAADIACVSSQTRYALLNALYIAGFHRIEICEDYIHVDIDNTKPQNVCWLRTK